MADESRNAIKIRDAKVAIDGRTFTPNSVTYQHSTPQSQKTAIGARIRTQDADEEITFSFEHDLTEEDMDLLLTVINRGTSFEITGRIPRRDGTYIDFVIPNCTLDTRSLNLQVGSTTAFSGQCDQMKIL